MKRIMLFVFLVIPLLSSAQGYRGYYITGHSPRTANCDELYLIGLQADMANYVNYLGLDVDSLIPQARRSTSQVNGQWIWLMEAGSISLREIEKGRRQYGIYVLPGKYASQLGAPFALVKGSNGENLIDSTGNYIIQQKEEIINWLWCLDNQTSPPVDFATNQDILTWITSRNLRLKWKLLFQAFQEPYGP